MASTLRARCSSSFIYALVQLQLEFVRFGTRSAAEIELELIALRHEHAVFRRQLCARGFMPSIV